MPGASTPPPAAWTLTDVTPAERPLLAALAQLYLYDFSEFDNAQIDEAGRFTDLDADLGAYGTDPVRHALLVRVAGNPAGFALIDELSRRPNGNDRHSIAEFFVMRAYRRRGFGAAVAHAIFDRFPGPWQVAQVAANRPAQAFWRRVIAAYTGGRYRERRSATGAIFQEFESRPPRTKRSAPGVTLS